MNNKGTAWESFLETGRIDDYLEYCYRRKQEMLSASGGAKPADAIESQWDRPAGLQNRRG